MKKTVYLALFIFAVLLSSVMPVQADGRGHGGGHGGWHGGHGSFYGSVWIGPGWGAGWWGPGWWGPYGYPSYPYYDDYYWAPPVVQEQPPAYVEPAPRAEEKYYWYFCPEAGNYYPYVKKCPKGWLRVVPPSAPSDDEE